MIDGGSLRGMDEEQQRKLWKQIGARLRTARKGANLTLEGLVEKLDNSVTFGALAHYERGIRPLPLPIAITVADFLHISAAELLGLEEADMTNEELRLMANFRRLPPSDQAAYVDRIEKMAQMYNDPLPDEPPVDQIRRNKPRKPQNR